MNSKLKNNTASAFSLIEALITISLIAVLVGIVISNYSDASSQSHGVIARQQTATLKSALDSYVMGSLSRATTAGYEIGTAASVKTISQLRTQYNAASTTKDRFDLIKDYIADESLVERGAEAGLYVDTVADVVKSISLEADEKIVRLPAWAVGVSTYPHVEIVDE